MKTKLELPRIDRIGARIATLERRLDHLQRRLASPDYPDYGTTPAAEYDRAEVAALEGAIKALNYVQQETK